MNLVRTRKKQTARKLLCDNKIRVTVKCEYDYWARQYCEEDKTKCGYSLKVLTFVPLYDRGMKMSCMCVMRGAGATDKVLIYFHGTCREPEGLYMYKH